MTFRLTRVNGQPGVVSYRAGRPYHVMVFEVTDGRVAAVRAVLNPDKLRRVPPLH